MYDILVETLYSKLFLMAMDKSFLLDCLSGATICNNGSPRQTGMCPYKTTSKKTISTFIILVIPILKFTSQFGAGYVLNPSSKLSPGYKFISYMPHVTVLSSVDSCLPYISILTDERQKKNLSQPIVLPGHISYSKLLLAHYLF